MTINVIISVPAGAPFLAEVEFTDTYPGKEPIKTTRQVLPGQTSTEYITNCRQLTVKELPV